MVVDQVPMQSCIIGNKHYGHITLSHLAVPETVKIIFFGEEFIPESFDVYGHPNFTEEQAALYRFRQESHNRRSENFRPLILVAYYQERSFKVPRESFDTISGIKDSLSSLSNLIDMLNNRRQYCFTHPSDKLNEFILFGSFKLTHTGEVIAITKSSKSKFSPYADVESIEDFRKGNNHFSFTQSGFHIPEKNCSCPCCGKTITIDDLKNNPVICVDGKSYHEYCYINYRKLLEVDTFTRRLMNFCYSKTEYTCELVDNRYSNPNAHFNIPWILFHTVDGDILIGSNDDDSIDSQNRSITIEWQKNYKDFNLSKLSVNVFTESWKKDGKRGVKALNHHEARMYLERARMLVRSTLE